MTVMTTEKPAAEPVDFSGVQIGDTLTFLTADNGYGGTGGYVSGSGTVTSKTDKSISVHTGTGRNARLLRRDWSSRSVRRVVRL